jgi:hypothetical protein
MSTVKEPLKNAFADPNSPAFVVRWRGREQGPYAAELIERKLAANEMGLLHEVLHNGQWLTVRDYLAQRQAALRAQRQTEEDQKRSDQQREEKLARERELQRHASELAQDRRKDEMLQTLLQRQTGLDPAPAPAKPHRGGLLLLLALAGLVLPFLSTAAWVMAGRDLLEMKVGRRDAGMPGRFLTDWARAVGILGTTLWILVCGFLIFALFFRH